MKYFLLILIPLACNSPKSNLKNYTIIYDSLGRIEETGKITYVNKKSIYEGLWTDYQYLNGDTIKSTRIYINDTLHGPYTRYYSNGQKETIQMYKKGKRNGKRIEFNKNGDLREISHWTDGICSEKIVYYPNNKIEVVNSYELTNNVDNSIYVLHKSINGSVIREEGLALGDTTLICQMNIFNNDTIFENIQANQIKSGTSIFLIMAVPSEKFTVNLPEFLVTDPDNVQTINNKYKILNSTLICEIYCSKKGTYKIDVTNNCKFILTNFNIIKKNMIKLEII